ncbi:MAG: DUF1566 domain-containing protein [Deltaproteobacteria bacterium]|nr:DUF1566 domain-containing protein [Deltaproteobacteria bacterium]
MNMRVLLVFVYCIIFLSIVGIGLTSFSVAGPVRVTSEGIEFSDGSRQASSRSSTWQDRLPAAERFKPLLDIPDSSPKVYSAVLDRETELVWEKTPDSSLKNWADACAHCSRKELGERKGWRLPTIEELASLVDPSSLSPSLPSNCPFTGVQSYYYWSATSDASNKDNAWYVVFSAGYVGKGNKKTESYVWCVRGGNGGDVR